MEFKIIALCSPTIRNGKDTVATILGCYSFNRVAIADAGKALCYELGWNGIKDEKGRKLIIDVLEGARAYDQLVWIKKAIPRITSVLSDLKHVVISDLRWLHEIEYLDSVYGEEIEVIVIGIESKKFGDISLKDHVTQADYYKIQKDYIINNNGSIQDLEKEVENVIQQIIEKDGGV